MAQKKSNLDMRAASSLSEHPSMNFDGNPMSSQTCLQGKRAGQAKKEPLAKRFFKCTFFVVDLIKKPFSTPLLPFYPPPLKKHKPKLIICFLFLF